MDTSCGWESAGSGYIWGLIRSLGTKVVTGVGFPPTQLSLELGVHGTNSMRGSVLVTGDITVSKTDKTPFLSWSISQSICVRVCGCVGVCVIDK